MKKKYQIVKIIKRVWFTIAILFTIWLFYSYQAKNVPDSYLETSAEISVKDSDDYFLFEPKQNLTKSLFSFPAQWLILKLMCLCAEKFQKTELKFI
jgi:hypothetical protein